MLQPRLGCYTILTSTEVPNGSTRVATLYALNVLEARLFCLCAAPLRVRTRLDLVVQYLTILSLH